MANPRILIISPSGNFYGSEQVLYDYLSHTKVNADVAVPAYSFLFKKLKQDTPQFSIKAFQPSGLWKFYLQLLIDLFLNHYQSVYLNEAGHMKYVLLLSKIFRRKKFIIHVRIVEDAAKSRWKVKPGPNVTLISISNYLAAQLPYPSEVLYDPFPFSYDLKENNHIEKEQIIIGIIGRITLTKGLNHLVDLLTLIRQKGKEDKFHFKLFGNISPDAEQSGLDKKLKSFENVTICGFEDSKEKLYSAVECVMHLSTQEALGRIYLEAIDYGKPFIGLRAAGIGEIASVLKMEKWMADPSSDNLPNQLLSLLENVKSNYREPVEEMIANKPVAEKIFNIGSYTGVVDKLLV